MPEVVEALGADEGLLLDAEDVNTRRDGDGGVTFRLTAADEFVADGMLDPLAVEFPAGDAPTAMSYTPAALPF